MMRSSSLAIILKHVRTAGAAVLCVAAASVAACGGQSASMQCGPGTHPSGTVCISTDGGHPEGGDAVAPGRDAEERDAREGGGGSRDVGADTAQSGSDALPPPSETGAGDAVVDAEAGPGDGASEADVETDAGIDTGTPESCGDVNACVAGPPGSSSGVSC